MLGGRDEGGWAQPRSSGISELGLEFAKHRHDASYIL